uniref:Uncharacterized protein n=1 Tax=viral metagenome TaxID=1070528 RepID=A0A6C0AQC1_9ZZZZ
MPPLLIIQFTVPIADTGHTETIWHAFSSSSPSRTQLQLLWDTCYELGYQLSYPSDKYTKFGEYENHYCYLNSLTIQQRSQGLRFVYNDDSESINTMYPIITMEDSFNEEIPESAGIIVFANHHIIEPNLSIVIPPDSDSDSDSE